MSNIYVTPCGWKCHFGEAKEIASCLDICKHQEEVCFFENEEFIDLEDLEELE